MVKSRHIAVIALSVSISMSVTACSAVMLPNSPNATACGTALTIANQQCRISEKIASHIADLKDLQYERSIYNFTTLAAGLFAAAGLVYGANNELIAGAGLTAGATQVIATSGAPAQKQLLLIQTNRRLTCAANRTQTAMAKFETSVDDAVAADLLRDAVDTIEQNLLTQWISSTSTLEFKTVLNNITASASVGPQPAEGENEPKLNPEQLEANRKALATALAACASE